MKTTLDTTIETTTQTESSPGRFRWSVAFAAIVGIVPYVVLKVLWITGSRIGIVDPNFGKGATMALLNSATALMDVVAVVLALSFVTSWGRRIAAPVLLLPMWVATGLLGQILVALPLQLVVGDSSSTEGRGASVLANWVPTLVYSGFAWQGAFLILGFALYANERWGGRVRAAGPLTRSRVLGSAAGTAVAGAVAVAGLAIVTSGSGPLEFANAVASSSIALCAAAAVVVYVRSRGASNAAGASRLAAAGFGWFGSGAMFGWGSYLTLMALIPNDLRAEGGIDLAGVAQAALTAAVGALCGAVLLRAALLRATTPATD